MAGGSFVADFSNGGSVDEASNSLAHNILPPLVYLLHSYYLALYYVGSRGPSHS